MASIVTDHLVALSLPRGSIPEALLQDLSLLQEFNSWEPEQGRQFLPELGQRLYRLAFPTEAASGDFANAFATSLNGGGFRARLFPEDADAFLLPWEFMAWPPETAGLRERLGIQVDAERPFLALHPQFSFVRCTHRDLPQYSLDLSGKLRVLIVWADPADDDWGPVHSAAEQSLQIEETLRRKLRGSHVETRVLNHATPATLRQEMKKWQPHALHYTGHGSRRPSLVMEKEGSSRDRHEHLSGEDLRDLCLEAKTAFVFLNCCWGAFTSPAHSGIAQMLSRGTGGRAVPVVLAHQTAVPQYFAASLAATFYPRLAETYTVEEALKELRHNLVKEHPKNWTIPEWGLPVLYQNVHVSRFFVPLVEDRYPRDFSSVLSSHTRLVGREYLRARVADFLKTRDGGAFLLTGPPGVGKSAFLANWIKENSQAACFFYQIDRRSDPDECIRSLHAELGGLYHIGVGSRPPEDRRARESFESLLAQVSALCVEEGKKAIVVIDALDEAQVSKIDGADAARVLPAEWPMGVYLLASARPVAIADKFARHTNASRFEFDPLSADNKNDAERYALQRLRLHFDGEDGHLKSVARLLAARSQGNFLVLSQFLHSQCVGRFESLSEVERAAMLFTGHLDQVYDWFFDRIMECDTALQRCLYHVLGTLLVARDPVTKSQLCHICGLEEFAWTQVLSRVEGYLERGSLRTAQGAESAYRIYHETFRLYLRKRLSADLKRRHEEWAQFTEYWAQKEAYDRVYALRHLVAHLLGAGSLQQASQQLLNIGFLQASVCERGIYGLLEDITDSLSAFAPPKAPPSQLRALSRALDLNASWIAGDPGVLFQQVSNTISEEQGADSSLGRQLQKHPANSPWLRLESSLFPIHDSALLRTLLHPSTVTSVAFSPDRTLVASGSLDNSVRLWVARSGRLVETLEGHSDPVRSVAFSPDGTIVASGSSDRTVRMWEVRSGRLLETLEGHTEAVTSVAFSPDGALVASGSNDQTVQLWEARSGLLIEILKGHTGEVASVAFSPDGALVASGSDDQTVRLWEARSGRLVETLEGHSYPVRSVAFSPDGALVASGSVDGNVRLWESRTGRLIETLACPTGCVTCVAFSPDGALVASGSQDGRVWLWRACSGQLLGTLQGHPAWVSSVAFSQDGALVSSGLTDRKVRLWDVRKGLLLDSPKGFEPQIMSATISLDGALVASGSMDVTVRLFEARSGRLLGRLEGHTGLVFSVAISPDGALVASGSGDNTVRLWAVNSGQLLETLAGHTELISSVAFSSDGALVASGSWDRTVRLWEARSGLLIETLENPDAVFSVAFSPNGALVASGSLDNTVRLWDVGSGQLIETLTGHSSYVSAVALSTDGALVASGSGDGTVRLWEASSGRLIETLEGHTGAVTSMAFSSDGEFVASGSDDGSVRLWEARSGRLICWTPCSDAVFSIIFDKSSGRISIADRGGARRIPNVLRFSIIR